MRPATVALLLGLVALTTGCAHSDAPPPPGFSVYHSKYIASDGKTVKSTWWLVINEWDSGLTIKHVTYNGEFEDPMIDPLAIDTDYPIILLPAPRNACHFLHQSFQDDPVAQARSYRKPVKYLDIETDRGTFRFWAAENRLERLH